MASPSSPQCTASTVDASSRAFESSSSVMLRGLPSAASATTQILFSAMSVVLLDDLELLEELDDALVSIALVDDDLAGLALFGRGHVGDLLAGAGLPDLAGVEAEVGDLQLLDRLALGGHDPLEARV